MNQHQDLAIEQALKKCASEPVHAPGYIQSFSYLFAFHRESHRIGYVSENIEQVLQIPAGELLGKVASDILGADIWHNILNALGFSDFQTKRFFVGTLELTNKTFSFHASASVEYVTVEIEQDALDMATSPDILRDQMFLVERIQTCRDEQSLFEATCNLLRQISGFDRAMIYRFDGDWNGEVVAEAHNPLLETFAGLHFPSWDIPTQARAIMARVPIRLIADVEAAPVPIVSNSDSPSSLDISLAQNRGVSPVHLTYLKNMGSAATMTLSIMLDGKLWGMISLHHTSPRVAVPAIRQLLASFLPAFCLKLDLLRKKAALRFSQRIDRLQKDIQTRLENYEQIEDLLAFAGPQICELLSACGIAGTSNGQVIRYGATPPDEVVNDILSYTQHEGGSTRLDCLADVLPHVKDRLGDISGVLANTDDLGRSLMLFRKAQSLTVHWAGKPEKSVHLTNGEARLEPRGSFSAYLQKTEGRSIAWSNQDAYLLEQLWPLLDISQRHVHLAGLNQHQHLLIRELSHRMRNVLALVQAIARRTEKSAESTNRFAQNFIRRIHDLAAAFEFGLEENEVSGSVHAIIQKYLRPFSEGTNERLTVEGDDHILRAKYSPSLALVFYELATNAVKHGALSGDEGKVCVSTQVMKNSLVIRWSESHGPEVITRNSQGFGTTLIREVIQRELNGSVELDHARKGLTAVIKLPDHVLAPEASMTLENKVGSAKMRRLPSHLASGFAVVVEDSFLLGSDMTDLLKNAGFQRVELFTNATDAESFLAREAPSVVILDMHLGQGQTGESIADKLKKRKIPFIFVTGSLALKGQNGAIPDAIILTKPVAESDLTNAIETVVR